MHACPWRVSVALAWGTFGYCPMCGHSQRKDWGLFPGSFHPHSSAQPPSLLPLLPGRPFLKAISRTARPPLASQSPAVGLGRVGLGLHPLSSGLPAVGRMPAANWGPGGREGCRHSWLLCREEAWGTPHNIQGRAVTYTHNIG